jgi:DNA-binding NtrC family response regulator
MRPKTIAPDVVALLSAYDWKKNNVRELRNTLERMMIASDAPVIGVAETPPEMRRDDRDDDADPAAAPGTLRALKAQAERQIVVAALEKHGGHITKTAEALGLADHSSLLKIMRRHGLSSR